MAQLEQMRPAAKGTLAVTAQRLIDVGEVAVLVVAEDPQPVEKTRVRSERRAGAVRQRRMRIAFEPA